MNTQNRFLSYEECLPVYQEYEADGYEACLKALEVCLRLTDEHAPYVPMAIGIAREQRPSITNSVEFYLTYILGFQGLRDLYQRID